MVLAMMLPSALPFISAFDTRRPQSRTRPRRLLQVTLLVTGYLTVWLIFSLIAGLAFRAIQQLVALQTGPQAASNLLLQAALVIAGAYQFAPGKRRTIARSCAPPHPAPDQINHSGALLLGLHYGLQCLGSCWALMLLMFAGTPGAAGHDHNITQMLVLGALMTAEKNTLWAPRLSRSLGAFLIALAILSAWPNAHTLLTTHTH
jgi:predicted metal-binding membrane protein